MAREKAVPTMSFHCETTGTTGVGNLPRSQGGGRAHGRQQSEDAESFSSPRGPAGPHLVPGAQENDPRVWIPSTALQGSSHHPHRQSLCKVTAPVGGRASSVRTQTPDPFCSPAPQCCGTPPRHPLLLGAPHCPPPPRASRGAWHGAMLNELGSS